MTASFAPQALIFDFDGVLLESEYAGNAHLAAYLTAIGHPHTPQEAMQHFMGLSGTDFTDAIERRIGGPLPADFRAARDAEDARALECGIEPVAGAIAFLRSLPGALPVAIASSSSKHWIRTHLAHLGIGDIFGDRMFSGREDVARGKPAPDLYRHAAAALGVPIAGCAIIEDSPVGATGAVASGAFVIGLTAGHHCPPDHDDTLRRLGCDAIAPDFEAVSELLGFAR